MADILPEQHRVLAGVSRVAVLEALRRLGRAATVPEIAAAVGLHPNTVRAHLDLLVEHGHVLRASAQGGRRGRPSLLFSASPTTRDDRNYRLLAEIFTRHLAASEQPARVAIAAGRDFGRALADASPQQSTTGGVVERIVAVLTEIGFEPQVGDDGATIALHHCPFLELATERQDIVCGVHLGVMQGTLDRLGADVGDLSLVPFVSPGLCLTRLRSAAVETSAGHS